MKKILSILFLLVAVVVTAQESYTLKMSVSSEGLPAEYEPYVRQEIITYLKGDQMKRVQSGMMGNSTMLYDRKKLTSLMEGQGSKIGFTATKAELDANDKEDVSEKPKIEFTNEKKMIAGYECSKVIMTSVNAEKVENKAILWVTDQIKYDPTDVSRAMGKSFLDFSVVKGYPLAMETSQEVQGLKFKIIMTTTEISTAALDDSVFAVDTQGYTMMSYKEMLDQQKAMMGGR